MGAPPHGRGAHRGRRGDGVSETHIAAFESDDGLRRIRWAVRENTDVIYFECRPEVTNGWRSAAFVRAANPLAGKLVGAHLGAM